jgi:hypothetical protein
LGRSSVAALYTLASVVSLVLRYRRSSGEVREQIKWIAFAASFLGLVHVGLLSAGVVAWLISATETLGEQSLWGALMENVTALSFTGVPVRLSKPSRPRSETIRTWAR